MSTFRKQNNKTETFLIKSLSAPFPLFPSILLRLHFQLGSLPDDIIPEKKRKADSGGGGGGAKKAKKAAEPDTTGIDWAAAAAAGELSKQTVPNLKAFLKSKGLPVGGKKADIVDRVAGALQ
jgi:hypothetical protein